MKRNWFYILSPCMLAAIFCLVVVIASALQFESSGGWSMLGIMMFAPAILISLVLDVLIKAITQKRVLIIWIVEIIIIVIAYFVYYRFLFV